MCDLETSRMGAPYIYDISHLRVKCKTSVRNVKRSDFFALAFRFAIEVEHIPLLLPVAGPSVLLNN